MYSPESPTTYLQSITGPHPGIIDDTDIGQSQYTAPGRSSLLVPSHQACTNRFPWIADARPNCGILAARVISEIDGGTSLVTPSDMGSLIR